MGVNSRSPLTGGGIFLCSVCHYGSLINNSFREYLLDLSERKLELLARSEGSDINATEAALSRTVAAIDTVMHRCQWYADTEPICVFGVRLDIQLLRFLTTMTMTQVWLLATSFAGWAWRDNDGGSA